MLPLTHRLLDSRTATSRRWRSAAAAAVLRHGSRDDAEALLPLFLETPETHADLLPVFAQHGDITTAERLMKATLVNGVRREDVPSEVLQVLGYLGHEAAEQILWHHVVREDGDYYESMDAALGLLHLPCDGLQDQIDAALDLHFGANVFPEFLPALAVKTGTTAWLDRLVAWGETGASTDCNGGLILGIALHGEAGRAEFRRLVWNPWWEAGASATGSSRWTYAGARALGIGMAELYGELTAHLASDSGSDSDEETTVHCFSTFVALLDHWVRRPWLGLRMAPDPEETADELATLLFDWSTPHEDDSLTGLAYRVLDRDSPLIGEVHELERRLEVRLRHEVELQVLADAALQR